MWVYLILSLFIFLIGTLGLIMHYKNFIFVLICLEMILLSINILFVSSSIFFDDLTGQIYSLLILSIAASESALGLTLFIVYYRLRGVITIDSINSLKG